MGICSRCGLEEDIFPSKLLFTVQYENRTIFSQDIGSWVYGGAFIKGFTVGVSLQVCFGNVYHLS